MLEQLQPARIHRKNSILSFLRNATTVRNPRRHAAVLNANSGRRKRVGHQALGVTLVGEEVRRTGAQLNAPAQRPRPAQDTGGVITLINDVRRQSAQEFQNGETVAEPAGEDSTLSFIRRTPLPAWTASVPESLTEGTPPFLLRPPQLSDTSPSRGCIRCRRSRAVEWSLSHGHPIHPTSTLAHAKPGRIVPRNPRESRLVAGIGVAAVSRVG